jgi:hypothetical protein
MAADAARQVRRIAAEFSGSRGKIQFSANAVGFRILSFLLSAFIGGSSQIKGVWPPMTMRT